jgi:curli biogenesis system outer membrane secretion channel CsgG
MRSPERSPDVSGGITGSVTDVDVKREGTILRGLGERSESRAIIAADPRL